MAGEAVQTLDPLDRRPLPAILADLSRRRASGALAVVGGSGRRMMMFREGRLRATRSTFEAERLGAWLAGRARIRDAELALALLTQSGPDAAPLGRLLLERGLIDEPTLARELEELGVAILCRATTEPRRQVRFDVGVDSRQPDTLPDRATARFILVTARSLDAEREAPRVLADPGRTYRCVGAPSTLASRLDATPDERRVLSALAAPRTLGDLTLARLMPPDALRRALLPLVMCGAVAPASAVADAPSAPRAGGHGVWSDAELEERAIVTRFMGETSDRDHYAVLGLEAGASYADIEASWTRLAARFDPARATRSAHLSDLGPELEKSYERIRTAYETLIDPTSRVAYNRIHKASRLQAGARAAASSVPKGTPQDQARRAIVQANLRRADQALRTGDRHTAYTLLEAACALEPEPEALLKLARLMITNPMWGERALARLKQALELDPGLVDGWLELATYWRRRERPDRERRALQQALEVAPDDRRAEARLAELDDAHPGHRR